MMKTTILTAAILLSTSNIAIASKDCPFYIQAARITDKSFKPVIVGGPHETYVEAVNDDWFKNIAGEPNWNDDKGQPINLDIAGIVTCDHRPADYKKDK